MQPDARIEAELALWLAPLDRRALGIAFGTAGAMAVVVLTLAWPLIDPEGRFPLGLLAQYFPGYTPHWSGAFVGAAWAFLVGFCGGWFFAFCRNLVLTLWLMKVRIRADVDTSRDILDHI